MSTFLSNKFLKYRNLSGSKAAGSKPRTFTIDIDLACIGCGYNIRGLNYGRNCPECGREIIREENIDPLLAGDWSQKQRVMIGLYCLAAVLLYAGLARLVVFVGLVFLGWFGIAKPYLYAGLFASIVWIVGVWMVTDRRLHPSGTGVAALIWLSRLLSLLWIPAYAIWISTLRIGSPWFAGPMASSAVAAIILRGIAALGVLTMAVLLIRLASRSDLEDATRRIWLAVWLLPVTTLLMAVVPASVGWVFLLPIILLVLAWCWCVLLLGRGVWELAQHVRWSLRYTEERVARTHRQAEVRREMDADVATRVRPTPDCSPPDLRMDGPTHVDGQSRR